MRWKLPSRPARRQIKGAYGVSTFANGLISCSVQYII